MRRQFSAGIVPYYIKNNEIHYLLVQHPGGHWDFPKGKMEKGEGKTTTALRELKEETGLEAEIIPGFEQTIDYYFRASGDNIFKNVFFFLGELQSTNVHLSHEHTAYNTGNYEESYDKLTFKNAQEVLKQANIFLKDFVLKK